MLVAHGVLRERLGEVVDERGEGDEQPVGLAAEGAVDAGEGLHEQGALERAVEVERVQRRRVEAGEHHVLHDDELELVIHVAQPALDGLVLARPAHVLDDGGDVGGGAGVREHPLGRGVVASQEDGGDRRGAR